ncbi:unnamed protein product [Closterium sp. NIES-53]
MTPSSLTPWHHHRPWQLKPARREPHSDQIPHLSHLPTRAGSLRALLLALLLLNPASIHHFSPPREGSARGARCARASRGFGVARVGALIRERPRKHPEMEDAFRQRVDELLASFDSSADVAALSQQRTGCSCYHIRNNYCCSQNLCLCSPMCWNGQEVSPCAGTGKRWVGG